MLQLASQTQQASRVRLKVTRQLTKDQNLRPNGKNGTNIFTVLFLFTYNMSFHNGSQEMKLFRAVIYFFDHGY